MAVFSYIQKSQLEGALRLDAEYYQPKYLDLTVKLSNLKHSQQINNFAKVLRGKNPIKYTETGIPVIRAVNLRE